MSTEPIHRSFPVSGPVALDVRNAIGTVEITADHRTEAVVDVVALDDSKSTAAALERTRVEMDGSNLTVEVPDKWFGKGGRIAVTVAVPTGSSVSTKVATADVTIKGTLGGLEVGTATGNVHAGDVDGDAKVNSASGDVKVGAVSGDADLKTASGDIEIEAAGSARMHTASGDLRIGRLDGDATGRSASGDVEIGQANAGTVDLTTVSGDVRVRVPSGRLVWLDLQSVSGRTESQLKSEDAPDDAPVLTVRARSVSGSIVIGHAV